MQLAYMILCKNGTVLKINTKFVSKSGDKEDLTQASIPVLPNEEPNFPRNKNPFLASKKSKGGEIERKLYVDREFFVGHRYKVLCFGFVENSSMMMTLDMKGYIYLWSYDRASFTSELNFKPSEKLKLELNYTRFIPESSTRLFPTGKDKEINPNGKLNQATIDKIGEYMSTLNIPEIKDKAVTTVKNNKDQTTTFYVGEDESIQKYGVVTFNEFVFNSKGLCIKAAESKYQAQPDV